MAVQDELAHAGTDAPPVEGPVPPNWWQSRSRDELQAIMRRGIQGGETFLAAATEMERRAREADAIRRADEVHEVEDGQRLKKMALVALILLPLAVAAVMRVEGFW